MSHSPLYTTSEQPRADCPPSRVLDPHGNHHFPEHGCVMWYRRKEIDPLQRLTRQYHETCDHLHESLHRNDPYVYLIAVASSADHCLHLYLVQRSAGMRPHTMLLIEWLRACYGGPKLGLPRSFFAWPFTGMKATPFFFRDWVMTRAHDIDYQMDSEARGLMTHQHSAMRFIRWRMTRPVVTKDAVFAPMRLQDHSGRGVDVSMVSGERTSVPPTTHCCMLTDPPRHGKTATALTALLPYTTVFVTSKPGVLPIWQAECQRLGLRCRLLNGMADAVAFCASHDPSERCVILVSVFILHTLSRREEFRSLWSASDALVIDEFHTINTGQAGAIQSLFIPPTMSHTLSDFQTLMRDSPPRQFLLLVSATPPIRARFNQLFGWVCGWHVGDYSALLMQAATTLSTEFMGACTPNQELLVHEASVFFRPGDHRKLIHNFRHRWQVSVPVKFKISQMRIPGAFNFRIEEARIGCNGVRFPPVIVAGNNPRFNSLQRVHVPMALPEQFGDAFSRLRALAEGNMNSHLKMEPRLRRLCQHVARMLAADRSITDVLDLLGTTENVWRELTSRGNFRATGQVSQCLDSLPEGWTLLPDTSGCSVCFTDYTEASEVLALGCRHVYCRQCLMGWFRAGHNTCPMCRKHVTYAHRTTFGELQSGAEVPAAAAVEPPISQYNSLQEQGRVYDSMVSTLEQHQKWIVFFQKVETLQEFRAHVSQVRPDVSVFEVSGGVPTSRWHPTIERWGKSDSGVILLTYAAGAEGLSLSSTRQCLLAEPPYAKSKFLQAIQRTKVFDTNSANVFLIERGPHNTCEWDILLAP